MLVLVFGPSGQSQFWEFLEIQAFVYCVPTHRRATKNLKSLEAMKSPVGSQFKLLNNLCGTMQFPTELLICILFRAAVQFWFAAILERWWMSEENGGELLVVVLWDASWVSRSWMALKYLKRLVLLWSLIFIVRFSSRSWSIFVLKRKINCAPRLRTRWSLRWQEIARTNDIYLFGIVLDKGISTSVEFQSMGLILLLPRNGDYFFLPGGKDREGDYILFPFYHHQWAYWT